MLKLLIGKKIHYCVNNFFFDKTYKEEFKQNAVKTLKSIYCIEYLSKLTGHILSLAPCSCISYYILVYCLLSISISMCMNISHRILSYSHMGLNYLE